MLFSSSWYFKTSFKNVIAYTEYLIEVVEANLNILSPKIKYLILRIIINIINVNEINWINLKDIFLGLIIKFKEEILKI